MTSCDFGTHVLFESSRDNDCLAALCQLLTAVLRQPGHVLLKMVFKQLVYL